MRKITNHQSNRKLAITQPPMLQPDPHHILIIEDDTAVARSLKQGLEEEGFKVSWRKEGQAGITVAQQQQPHLIILDIRLPDGSGLDFCREMRNLNLIQPILMLTARREELDKVLGLEMGADDYMTKPYGLRELVARIRALLRRAYGDLSGHSADRTRLYIRDLTINLDTAEVLRGSETLNLTPTEYRLLVFLARHPGQALSRSQILEGVWQDTAAIESERTVNVHIRRLREKVELTPSKPTLILTVPGIGYRLIKD
ncbi:MAG: response regulator transcription factor [Candidatus Promineifilaceae bacterium]